MFTNQQIIAFFDATKKRNKNNMKTRSRLCLIALYIIFNFQFSIFNSTAQTVHRERSFTASGLYGFMNGGTDQFLEYDVRQLVVRDIAYKGEEYSVEIYEMPTPEDAFGIYSLHTFRCMRADTLGCIDCLSPYQLQAVSGNQYVSVVFPSGSQAAIDAADELLRQYAPMDGKENPAIPALLDMKPPYSGKLKYLRGPLSVSTASFSFSQLVEDIPYKNIWFVSGTPSSDYRALIYLENKDLEQLKAKVPAGNIIQAGDGFLYLKGTEED